MTFDLDSRSLAVLFVRVSLALSLGAAGLALLTGNTGTTPAWLGPANFLIAIVMLWLHPRGDRFSVDALLARRGRGAALPGGNLDRRTPV